MASAHRRIDGCASSSQGLYSATMVGFLEIACRADCATPFAGKCTELSFVHLRCSDLFSFLTLSNA